MDWFKRSFGSIARLSYFGLLVAVAFYLVRCQAPEAAERFKAAKAMAVNHALTKGDLVAAEQGAALNQAMLDTLEGQFAQRVISAGQHVSAQDFAPRPLLLPPANLVLVGVNMPSDLKTENAGSVFHVCKGHQSVRDLRADAVLCPDVARTSCSVIFYLPASQARDLLDQVSPGKPTRLLPRACPEPRAEGRISLRRRPNARSAE